MWGAVGVLAVMYVGMVSTLGDGASGGQLNWRVDGGLVGWFATWRVRGRAGGILGLSLNGRLVAVVVGYSCWQPQYRHCHHCRLLGSGMGCCCVCGAGGLTALFG